MRNDQLFAYAQENYQNFFCTINKKNYLFRATLVNADGIATDILKGAVKELSLTDTIMNPSMSGYIIIDNPDNVIERYKTDPTKTEFGIRSTHRGYRVRGDARDLLMLSIIPVDPSTNPYNEQSISYNKIFGIQFVFVIVDEADTSVDGSRAKKFTFDDIDIQILKEKSIFFTTNSLLTNNNVAYMTDNERKVFVGDALKAIIRIGLGDPSVVASLSGTNLTPNFESGQSKIFYSSPTNNSAWDDVDYLLDWYVSNEPGRDFAFISKDHYTGEYTFESFSKMFLKAYDAQKDAGGQYFIENLTIAGAQDVSNVVENDIKKPLYALELGETSDVLDVKFFNTPGAAYQSMVNTTIVSDYDHESKEFHINAVDGNVNNVKNDFSTLFVAPMKGKDNKPTPNFIINNTQRTNQNYRHIFVPYSGGDKDLAYAVGRNRVLRNALMLNIGAEITVQGGLHRQSGKFISIDRTGSYVDNDFDNKFLGIYFVVSVDHSFINDDEFISKIIAVKTYHFTDPHINENIS